MPAFRNIDVRENFDGVAVAHCGDIIAHDGLHAVFRQQIFVKVGKFIGVFYEIIEKAFDKSFCFHFFILRFRLSIKVCKHIRAQPVKRTLELVRQRDIRFARAVLDEIIYKIIDSVAVGASENAYTFFGQAFFRDKPVRERNLAGATRQEAAAFLNWLTREGVSATVRREMGADIEGACGQLRRRVLHEIRD